MKWSLAILTLCRSIVLLSSTVCAGTVLFSDNYDRSDSTDVDASSTGMAGTLSPMTYMESYEGSGSAICIEVISNQLGVAYKTSGQTGMACLYLDHNFTDSTILSAGGFSVSLDIASIASTTSDTANRFAGFGIGMTAAEAAAAGDIGTSTTTMRGGSTAKGVADFFVDLALDNNLHVWHNGTALTTVAVGVATGTIKVEFYPVDFNAGSSVTAVIYFNGVLKTTQTFTWDNTSANYLGISGRSVVPGTIVDNLVIETCYNEKANNPSPANGAVDVAVDDVVLSWSSGTDPNGVTPLPNLGGYYVYLGEETDALYQLNTTRLTTATYNAGDLATDTTYYWQIEEALSNGKGGYYAAGDPNNIVSPVWSFSTIISIPIITNQPDGVLVDTAGTAEFTISVNSLSTAHYAWYKSTDASNSTSTDDVSVGTDSATLTLSNVSTSSAGYYYCVVSNDSGTSVASDVALLEIKQLMAWYQFEDSLTDSANDYDGTAVMDANTASLTYAAGKVGQSISLDGTDEAVEIPRSIQNSMTIELWVKTTASNSGTGGWWNGLGLVDGEVADYVDDFGTVLLSGKFSFGVGNDSDDSYVTISSTTSINDGQWHYCVATRDHLTGEIKVYVDGTQETSATASTGMKDSPEVLRIGSLQTAGNYLAGQIDEVKLYNYPLAELTVAAQYNAVTGEAVCVLSQKPDTKYDVNGDCVVNLEDVSVFVASWLNCGYYPQSECQ